MLLYSVGVLLLHQTLCWGLCRPSFRHRAQHHHQVSRRSVALATTSSSSSSPDWYSAHPEPTTLNSGNLTLEFSRSFNVPSPSYVQILREGILSVTSFSLMRKGFITEYDVSNINEKSLTPRELIGNYLWPNELSRFVDSQGNPVMLVPDGFLTPGQDDGGLFIVTNPDKQGSKPKRITALKTGWFYHKAQYLEIPVNQRGGGGGTTTSDNNGDSNNNSNIKRGAVARGVLTARANKPVLGRGQGELVWLKMPDDPSHTPWEEVVLAQGPDVMFEVTDLDPSDGHMDVISAHFFGDKISIASIEALSSSSPSSSPHVRVARTMTIDTKGKPYGLCLADLRGDSYDKNGVKKFSHLLVSTHECAYDMPEAFNSMLMTGSPPNERYPALRNHEMDQGRAYRNPYSLGGSLYSYEIPCSSQAPPSEEKEKAPTPTLGRVYDVGLWRRKTLFQGFKVKSWGNVNPGAPGFPYVFHLPEPEGGGKQGPPLILLAGDGTRSAYIFSPVQGEGSASVSESASASVLDSSTSEGEHTATTSSSTSAAVPEYELAFEVECGATVGSAAVSPVPDGSGDVEIIVPSYELNSVHMYRLHRAQAERPGPAAAGEKDNTAAAAATISKNKKSTSSSTSSSRDASVMLFSVDKAAGRKAARP